MGTGDACENSVLVSSVIEKEREEEEHRERGRAPATLKPDQQFLTNFRGGAK